MNESMSSCLSVPSKWIVVIGVIPACLNPLGSVVLKGFQVPGVRIHGDGLVQLRYVDLITRGFEIRLFGNWPCNVAGQQPRHGTDKKRGELGGVGYAANLLDVRIGLVGENRLAAVV